MPKQLQGVAARVLGGVVRLAAAAETGADAGELKTPEVKWIHIADEGTYKGYTSIPGGFTFTRETFETIQKNFRAHPQYRKGADGWGEADVVRYDYEHISMMDPTLGEIPRTGVPSPAWVRDLDIRTGDDGKAQLWALTWLGEQIRQQIDAHEYQWVSVVVAPSYIHPVTGEDQGPTLTSVAFTNDPFLQTLTPIAASATLRVAARRHFYEPAADPCEALGMLRGLFGLGLLATPADVQAQLAKLQAMIAAGTVPVGIDVEPLIGDLRTILNLPTLATAQEAIAEAMRVTAAATGGSSAGDNEPVAELLPDEVTTMDLKAELAKRLSLGANANEAAILLAVDDLIEEAQEGTAEQQAATEAADKLKAILEALGVADAEAAIAKIAEHIKKAEELKALLPELEALRSYKAQEEEKAVEQDVEEAMATSRLAANLRPALVLLRRNDPAAFAQQFPKVRPNETHLSRPFGSLPNGTQVYPPSAQPAHALPLSNHGAALDLRSYPGRNGTERILSHLKAQNPALAAMPFEAQLKAVAQFRRDNPHAIAD